MATNYERQSLYDNNAIQYKRCEYKVLQTN